jgi:hypothetical protein
MLRALLGVGLLVATVAFVAAVPACGTEAVGVETCRQIESARCQAAPACPNIDLGVPVHRGSPGTDVASCIRFYEDACLHGLATTTDPGGPAAKACVDAINAGDCAIVYEPQKSAACAWLIPPQPAVTDAGSDADTDAPSDAADASGS